METKFERKGKVIRNIETGEVKDFDSINLAKKESRKIQLDSGGLGCGCLVKR